MSYDRGVSMKSLMETCEKETGLPAPRPQWEKDPYGPHVGLDYVKGWYKTMREKGYEGWEFY
jgi:5-oxoprolinase (ATP-hydrolysing)